MFAIHHSGVVIVLFFQCMDALLNPVDRIRTRIRWGLVAQTVAMFASLTVYTAMSLHLHSISYVDNRNFPGIGGGMPGPLGYQLLIISKPISVVPNAMFPLNQWLADGLLVSPVFNRTTQVSNVGRPSSSIVAILFIP